MLSIRHSGFLTILLSTLLLCAACSGSGNALDSQPGNSGSGEVQSQIAFAAGLPADAVQPWERGTANALTEEYFVSGRESFLAGPAGVSENGEASRLESEAGQTAYVIYRIPCAGEQPGVLSIDANLLPDAGTGTTSAYYIALADYGSGRWQWQGPFSESHLHIVLPEQLGLSSAGSLLAVAMVADGGRIDVMGLGLDMRSSGDEDAPDAPTGLSLNAVSGGIELQWNDVLAGDLAGYRVYHSTRSFINPLSAGVQHAGYMEGGTRAILHGLNRRTYVRVTAVDFNGNESAPSAIASAVPLSGSAPALSVSIGETGVKLGEAVQLLASGAELYSFDADGDGVFEITDSVNGEFSIDTTKPGIIRPLVRASDAEGMAVALGSVSLFVNGNSRPVASAIADPQSGPAPLLVIFKGLAEDLEDGASDLSYAWDFDGDGIYEEDTDRLNPAGQVYGESGIFNVRFRVTDSGGLWDVDTVSVLVNSSSSSNDQPIAVLNASGTSGSAPFTVIFDAAASSDADGSVTAFAWDWEGDGLFDQVSYSPVVQHVFDKAGAWPVKLRVIDNEDGFGETAKQINVFPQSALPPQAVASVDRRDGPGPYILQFDASGSSDPDGEILLYEWDFDGDGSFDSSSSMPSASHHYTTRGTFNPLLRVTDDGGNTGVDSLALTLPSAWPMYGVDQFNTNRSSYRGPQTGSIDLYFFSGDVVGAPVFDHLGNMYIGTNHAGLNAFDPDGNLLWNLDTDDYYINSTAALGTDGTLYFGCDKGLVACNLQGEELWRVDVIPLESSPKIGPDGSIFVGGGGLSCVDPSGYVRWTFTTAVITLSSPAIARDGTIYITSLDGKLYALDQSGAFRWSYDTGEAIYGSPSIGADGTIYVGSNSMALHAVNPDGSEQWTFDTGDFIQGSPAIAPDGTVYIGNLRGDMYAVNPDGSMAWSYDAIFPILSTPLVDSGGTVYFGSNTTDIYALNPDGSELWTLDDAGIVESPLSLSAEGVLSFVAGNKLVTIVGE
ncbi:MAG: PKD domain-containing protein [bacterium]